MKSAACLALVLALAACQEPAFTEPVVLGGESVPAALLEQGKRVYGRYCERCHGVSGNGLGVASGAQWPPPRDFRLGKFKFAGVQDRGLPGDAELERIIRNGLRGTTMRPWRLRDSELRAVVQYIKTLSLPGKGFRNERLEVKPTVISADPFTSAEDVQAAIVWGEELYHASFQCSSCHPAYAGDSKHSDWRVSMRPDAPFDSVPKWSANYRSVLLPPDFLRHDMRSVAVIESRDHLDHDAADLYRSIAYGLQGPMPGFIHLGEDKVWAVAHYVKSLADSRNSDAARAMRDRLLRSASTPASSLRDPLQSAP